MAWDVVYFGYFWRQGRCETAGTWRTCPCGYEQTKDSDLQSGNLTYLYFHVGVNTYVI
jgi:hypothetical protein